jgi:hypothetical protein
MQDSESQDEVRVDIDTPVASREARTERRVLGLSGTDVLLLGLMTDLWEFKPAEKGQEAQWEESKLAALLQMDQMLHEIHAVMQQLGLKAGVRSLNRWSHRKQREQYLVTGEILTWVEGFH